ncbi:MAG: hypothetical protein ACRCZQ_09050 [Bacteroidales bacterium]
MSSCSKDDVPTIPEYTDGIDQQGAAAPRIYVVGEGDQAKLMLTKDPTNYGAFFQFGSIIGWSNGEETKKVFNPGTNQDPSWESGHGSGEHTLKSLRLGDGDPCRLVGYTIAEIKSELEAGRVPDNRKWRTPNNDVNVAFEKNKSNMTTLEGIKGRYFGPGATATGTGGEFLPAAGFRNPSGGTLDSQGEAGDYWSCTTGIFGYNGYSLSFDKYSGNMKPAALPVRCVQPWKSTVTFEAQDGGSVTPEREEAPVDSQISSVATATGTNLFVGWYEKDVYNAEYGYHDVKITATEGDTYVDGTKLTVKVTSNKTYTAKFVGESGGRIYLNSNDQLELTKDPKVEAIFFQFGSILAWKGTGENPVVAWNVTDLPSSWNGSWFVGSTVPAQTLENVKAGKGDPCKLVGLSKSQINGGTVDNNQWRTPNEDENIAFAKICSNWTTVSGINGRYFGPGATATGTGGEFLPAAGFREGGRNSPSDGTLSGQGTGGYYWSTTTISHRTYASYLSFGSSTVGPEDNNYQAYGHSVRCVPQ